MKSPVTPNREEMKNVKEILCFIAGSMFGGTVGVFVMCLLQINRIERSDELEKEEQRNISKTLS